MPLAAFLWGAGVGCHQRANELGIEFPGPDWAGLASAKSLVVSQ